MKKLDKDSFIYIALKTWKEDFWLKVLTFVSVGLMVTSFFLPPAGVIDPSVMAGIGELTGIGALWQFTKCINKNIGAKIKIKEIELSILKQSENIDNEDPKEE